MTKWIRENWKIALLVHFLLAMFGVIFLPRDGMLSSWAVLLFASSAWLNWIVWDETKDKFNLWMFRIQVTCAILGVIIMGALR